MFNKKGKYLIVLHSYWMHHISWETKVIENVTKKEAQKEASLLADCRRKEFHHVDWLVEELVNGQDKQA